MKNCRKTPVIFNLSRKEKDTDISEKEQQKELATGNLEINKSSRSFFKWIQEFSKKIVTLTFVLFVLNNISALVLIMYNYFTTFDLVYLDILLTETHTTFREVIGGYIIKAAAENTIKIIGSIIEKYYEGKYANSPAVNSSIDYSDDPGKR